MACSEQGEFIQIVKHHLPQFFSGTRVIEMGSLDINGSARPHFDAVQYVGVDLGPGPSHANLPAALERAVRNRFNPWRSARALKRRVKVAVFGNFLSSPPSYYLRGRR